MAIIMFANRNMLNMLLHVFALRTVLQTDTITSTSSSLEAFYCFRLIFTRVSTAFRICSGVGAARTMIWPYVFSIDGSALFVLITNRPRTSVRRETSYAVNWARYASRLALPHSSTEKNRARFDLLTWSTLRLDTDGYKQVNALTNIVEVKRRDVVIHLKVNVNVENHRSNWRRKRKRERKRRSKNDLIKHNCISISRVNSEGRREWSSRSWIQLG